MDLALIPRRISMHSSERTELKLNRAMADADKDIAFEIEEYHEIIENAPNGVIVQSQFNHGYVFP